MNDRLQEYIRYHIQSERMGDIDPSYPMLRYVCDRFELNMEQRFWFAFLYASCYCGATAYYIYNEFPDYENVDTARMTRWWVGGGKDKCYFQTDRRRVKSNDQFVTMYESYRQFAGDNQQVRFEALRGHNPVETYKRCYKACKEVFNMGRFGLFLWLEAIHVVTGYEMEPDGIDWKHAESSRNGLCFALGKDHWLRGHDYGDDPLPKDTWPELESRFSELIRDLRKHYPQSRSDAWNVETTLCAYKKFKHGKRYPGYYIDRQSDEITSMETSVTEGVCWKVLRQFRLEHFPNHLLKELGWRGEMTGQRYNQPSLL